MNPQCACVITAGALNVCDQCKKKNVGYGIYDFYNCLSSYVKTIISYCPSVRIRVEY